MITQFIFLVFLFYVGWDSFLWSLLSFLQVGFHAYKATASSKSNSTLKAVLWAIIRDAKLLIFLIKQSFCLCSKAPQEILLESLQNTAYA